jgi:putative erf recombinase
MESVAKTNNNATTKATRKSPATKKEPSKVTKMKKDDKQEFETIEALLIHVQSQLKVEKDIDNDFGGFSYYTIDNMLKQIRSALIEHGAFGRFSTTIEQKGERYYVQASFKVSYKGQTFEEVAEIREPVTKPKMDDSQVTRSATTQAKKTLLENIFMVFDGVEPDSANNNDYQHQTDSEVAEQHNNGVQITLNLIEHAKTLGDFAPSQEQVEKWTEMAHNNPKEAYKEVMAFGKNATAKMAENKIAENKGE